MNDKYLQMYEAEPYYPIKGVTTVKGYPYVENIIGERTWMEDVRETRTKVKKVRKSEKIITGKQYWMSLIRKPDSLVNKIRIKPETLKCIDE